MKSCSRKLQGEYDVPDSKFWKRLWSLKLPGKIINFLWRTCRACLPTAVALAAKMVQINTYCSWYLTHTESDVHVLFECKFAKLVWASAGLTDLTLVLPNDTAFEVIKRAFSSCTKEQSALFGLFC